MPGNPGAVWATAVLGTLAGACTGAGLLESHPTDGTLVEGQVRVTLDVSPEVLEAPGTILATLTYENLGSDTVVLVSRMGCLSFASVYRGDKRIPFPATQYYCTAAVTLWDLAPGDPIVVRWPLVVGGQDGYDAATGTYRFVAELNTHPVDLERTFVIR